MAQEYQEEYEVLGVTRVGEIGEMIDALKLLVDADPRGKETGEATAVQIGNCFVEIEARKFADGTREYALRAATGNPEAAA